ncbi:MAG: hypothetical protein ACM3X6_10735 [Patescibacteria group bacterium]
MRIPPLVWQNALITFVLSIILGTVLGLIASLPYLASVVLLLAFIVVGILFDMIGVAVAAADEGPLHAMGADRVGGSGQAVWLVRRAGMVANICNDVVGDVSNTISGAITISLAAALAVRLRLDGSLLSILVVALTAAATVGGKALGKVYALKKPHAVVVALGRVLSWLGWPGGSRSRRPRPGRKAQGRRY